MGKSTQASIAKKRPSSSAVAALKPSRFKGWGVCEKFIRKSVKEMCKGSTQLIHVIACSELLHGMEAEVNWYTGGNSYVTLPAAVAEAKPGVYLTRAKFNRMKRLPEEDQGPDSPAASITHLRWLGTRGEFSRMAQWHKSGKNLGKQKQERLMEMLRCSPN